MIALTQITNTNILTFIAVLVFKLLSFVYKLKKTTKILKSRLLFKKIAKFTGKLQQNYKELECEIFRIITKQVSNHLLVLFPFA